jgi:hypothetical protein
MKLTIEFLFYFHTLISFQVNWQIFLLGISVTIPKAFFAKNKHDSASYYSVVSYHNYRRLIYSK